MEISRKKRSFEKGTTKPYEKQGFKIRSGEGWALQFLRVEGYGWGMAKFEGKN